MVLSQLTGKSLTWTVTASVKAAVAEVLWTGLAIATTTPTLAQPLPDESDRELVTQFTALNNRVTIELNNETGAPLTYEVLGITDQRLLPPEQSVLLQNIPLDATLTAVRNDNGLIDITGSGGETGQLSLSIVREANFDDTQGVIIIEQSGRVLAY